MAGFGACLLTAGTRVSDTAGVGDADEGGTEQPVWLAGNVGGAWRIGGTVHRTAGPWTPAVHALLDFLAPRAEHTPRVLGFDEEGREVLTFLPGRVVDIDAELLTPGQIDSLVSWTRGFHEAVAGFGHPGPLLNSMQGMAHRRRGCSCSLDAGAYAGARVGRDRRVSVPAGMSGPARLRRLRTSSCRYTCILNTEMSA